MPSESQSARLRVVLVNTRNPLNIGAAARAMSNFGFLHLRVVNPYELAFREARSAVGASPLLARAEAFQTVAEAVADCTLVVGTTAAGRRDPRHPVKRLDEAAPLLRKRLASSRVALLFGSEKRGLSNDDLSHCHWLLRIPTREEHRSMNLGQAVAVCLYELARNSKALSRHPERSEGPLFRFQPAASARAVAGDLERLTSVLLDALRSSGYLKASPSASQKPPAGAKRNPPAGAKGDLQRADLAEEKIRRLVRRLQLSASDAELFLGILRQFLWKLR